MAMYFICNEWEMSSKCSMRTSIVMVKNYVAVVCFAFWVQWLFLMKNLPYTNYHSLFYYPVKQQFQHDLIYQNMEQSLKSTSWINKFCQILFILNNPKSQLLLCFMFINIYPSFIACINIFWGNRVEIWVIYPCTTWQFWAWVKLCVSGIPF